MIKLASLFVIWGLITFNIELKGLNRLSQNNNGDSFISKPTAEHKNCANDLCSQKNIQVVSRAELVEVYKLEKDVGYSMLTTTNAGRMQANIILRLVKAVCDKYPNGPPLFIDYRDNFAAYIEAMQISKDSVPLFVRQSFNHHQDQLIEYRKSKVLKKIIRGQEPIIAITAKAWWQKSDSLPNEFSYEDTLSDPKLMVINERVINYRILEFEEQIVLDEIQGIEGYPISGSLGLVFELLSLFGNPSVIQVRMAVSHDDLLIISATSKFVFTKTITSTIYPDGHAINDLPEYRPDLERIKHQLENSLEIEYYPYEK